MSEKAVFLKFPDGRTKRVFVSTFEEIKEFIDQQYQTFKLYYIISYQVCVIENDYDFQVFLKGNDSLIIYVRGNELETFKMFEIHTSKNRLIQLPHHTDESVTAARPLNPAVEYITENDHEPNLKKSFDALSIAPENSSLHMTIAPVKIVPVESKNNLYSKATPSKDPAGYLRQYLKEASDRFSVSMHGKTIIQSKETSAVIDSTSVSQVSFLQLIHGMIICRQHDIVLALESTDDVMSEKDLTIIGSMYSSPDASYIHDDSIHYFDYDLLSSMGETAYQQHIERTYAHTGVFFSESYRGGLLFPGLPGNDGAFPLRARPDLVSPLAPVLVKIKSGDPLNNKLYKRVTNCELRTIIQVMERMDVMLRVYGAVCQCYGFAVTDRGAHLLSCKRTTVWSPNKLLGRIEIWNLGRDKLLLNKVFKALTLCGHYRPRHYFNYDRYVLYRVLNSIGFNGHDCRIHTIGHSISDVYAITTPRWSKVAKKSCWNIPTGVYSFVIKTIESCVSPDEVNMSKYYVEKCLELSPPIKTYLWGCIRKKTQVLQWFGGHEPQFHEEGKPVKRGKAKEQLPLRQSPAIVKYSTDGTQKLIEMEQAWIDLHPSGFNDYDGLIMMAGDYSLSQLVSDTQRVVMPLAKRRQMFAQARIDVLSCLSRMHSFNLLHCDVRAVNIMWFQSLGRFEVIDFGMAVMKGTKVNIDPTTLKNCGKRVKNAAAKAAKSKSRPPGYYVLSGFLWKEQDDMDMMEDMFADAASQLNELISVLSADDSV